MARFSMRIVDADFYSAKPIEDYDVCFSEFRQSEVNRIPILRIFGATANGQKACLHVHQTFPYIYVPVLERDATDKFAKQFAASLDLAIHISLGKPISTVVHYVYKISIVNGFTFYGYHDREETFFKIFIYNPNLIKKIEELLLSGAIMNRVFQPYEGHIPYLLQFFIDYNLYGMNFIHLANVKFRQPLLFPNDSSPDSQTTITSPTQHKEKKSTVLSPIGSPSQTCYETWHSGNLAEDSFMPLDIERMSTCLLEVDALESDILNKGEIKGSLGSCPGLAAIWEEEKQRRRMKNESTDIAPPISQGERQNIIHETELKYLEDFRLIIEERRQRSVQIKSSSETTSCPDLESPNLISGDGKTPELETSFGNFNFDESQPIVNENAIHECSLQSSSLSSSQNVQSPSQVLMSTLDNQLVDILAGLAQTQDPILSQASQLTNEEGEQLLEDDMNETLVMSQFVYDDVMEGCKEINNDENREDLDEDFQDSWSASMVDEIPQIDGTFDIEDTIERKNKTKIKAVKTPCKKKVGLKDNVALKCEARNSVQCSCFCSDLEMTKGKEMTEGLDVLQVDGSNDSDFVESDNFQRMRNRKTPLRTYQKLTRKQILENSRDNSTERVSSRSGENAESRDKKPDYKVASKYWFCDTRKVPHEEGDEMSSIFSTSTPTGRKATHEGDFVMSPKEFYSSSKQLSLRKTANRRRDKRLNLKPLEFKSSESCLETSKSRPKVAWSEPSGKRMSFTEIVPDSKNVEKNLEIQRNDDSRKEMPMVQRNAIEAVSSPNIESKWPDKSFHGSKLIGNSADLDCSNENLNSIKSKNSSSFRTENLNQLDVHSKAVKTGTVVEERNSSSIRECYVRLTDLKSCKTSSLQPSSGFKKSLKRKADYHLEKNSKKIRRHIADGDDQELLSFKWWSNDGLFIGIEEPDGAKLVDTCCDSLWKSSFPSPKNADFEDTSSPPRPNSPNDRYTKLFTSQKVPSNLEVDPCTMKVHFQHDRSCALIKPVRLNFDSPYPVRSDRYVEMKADISDNLKVKCDSEISNQGERPPVKDELKTTEEAKVSACEIPAIGHLLTSKNDERDKQSSMLAALDVEVEPMFSIDSPHSFDYVVNFSPAIDNPPSADKKQQNTKAKIRKRLGSGRVWLRQKTSASKRNECFDIPNAGDATQSEVSISFKCNDQINVTSSNPTCSAKSKEICLVDDSRSKTEEQSTSCNSADLMSASETSIKNFRYVGNEAGNGDSEFGNENGFAILESKETVLANDSIDTMSSSNTTESETVENVPNRVDLNKNAAERRTNVSVTLKVDKIEEANLKNRIDVFSNGTPKFAISNYKCKGNDHKIIDIMEKETGKEDACTYADNKKERSNKRIGSLLIASEEKTGQITSSSSTTGEFLTVPNISEPSFQLSEIGSLTKTGDGVSSSPLSPPQGITTSSLSPPQDITTSSLAPPQSIASQTNEEFIAQEHSTVILTPMKKPPNMLEILETAKSFGLSETCNQKAFFSDPKDLPAHASKIGGQKLRIKSTQVSKLPHFQTESGFQGSLEKFQNEALQNTSLYADLCHQAEVLDIKASEVKGIFTSDRKVVIIPCKKPPKQIDVREWVQRKLGMEGKEKSLKGKKNVIKSPNATGKQVKVAPDSPIFRTPGDPKKDGKIAPKESDASILQSPCFSPTTDTSALSTRPVSSTPMIAKKKAPLRLPITPGIANTSKPKLGTPGVPDQMKRSLTDSSQIDGPTPRNSYGFGFTQVNYDNARHEHEIQHLTLLSMELHVKTRRDLCPDPTFDPICAIFYHLNCETKNAKETGIFILDEGSCDAMKGIPMKETSNRSSVQEQVEVSRNSSVAQSTSYNDTSGTGKGPIRNLLHRSGVCDHVQRYYNDEKTMIMAFQSFVKSRDPDIIVGYEIQMLSWGYLIDRSKELDVNLCPLLSRVQKSSDVNKLNDDVEKEAVLYGHVNDVKIVGRILLNVWQIMRSEVTLRWYSFENVAFHVLHKRVPKYSFRTLSSWWSHQSSLHRWRVVDYYVMRCRANIEMLVRTDFLSRTSELARIFGILFYSVISRGSQFRVESMMLRIAKPMGFIPVSPSIRQRALMAAPEIIPLVMEPESRLYTDPVIVLDFQSLYPSIIIAYNYCFSTCLGRVKHWNEPASFKYGATSLSIPTAVFEKIKDSIHISPNGVGFVKQNIRKGILPRMLDDILKTRIMVKNSMKKNKENKALHRMLDARQLGLKLIANVTYGYTSANFSGRMPCVEIADSVVRKGREALETAINVINSTEKWNARVVYGDTDSVFILMKGATKKRAFEVATEIVDVVTNMNPQPMKLKFEKVYMPCILQTKKRYVGYMYESLDQSEPVFDAKGIETVRRDSCAAVSKILERSLKTLFETKDLSLVKRYVERQFTKILEDRVSIQDFTFAKEYRGLNNYRPGACVPALAISRRLLAYDKRAEPRGGERVPYVIVYGTPGLPLIQLVKRPCELIQDSNLRLNGLYYITKQIIPSLNRAFSLIGVDIFSWFNDLPRPQRRLRQQQPFSRKTKKGTIAQYFSSVHCPICDELTRGNICENCLSDPQNAVTILSCRVLKTERKLVRLSELCYHCTGSRDQINKCISLDCPVFHKLFHVKTDLADVENYRTVLDEMA